MCIAKTKLMKLLTAICCLATFISFVSNSYVLCSDNMSGHAAVETVHDHAAKHALDSSITTEVGAEDSLSKNSQHNVNIKKRVCKDSFVSLGDMNVSDSIKMLFQNSIFVLLILVTAFSFGSRELMHRSKKKTNPNAFPLSGMNLYLIQLKTIIIRQ